MLAAAALVCALIPGAAGDVPVPIDAIDPDPPPEITAPAYILYDATAGVELLARSASERRAMASVTKLMTALVVRDHADLLDRVVITESAAATGEAEVGLVAGETWTVYELLAAILVRSGNDAATALAEHVGGSVEGFSVMMNAKAAELGMAETSYANPHGLDDEGHFTTARDLLTLTLAAMEDPVINRLARTGVIKFRDSPEGDARIARNTNALLGRYEGMVGGKTGFTNDAGKVLASSADRDGRVYVAVVMGSEDHFADSRLLYEYAFASQGVADHARIGLRIEQGGGAPPPASPPWVQPRLMTLVPLAAGEPAAPRPPTPLEAKVFEKLMGSAPELVTVG